jgi:putative ABC transport system ATP-binding protein
MIKAKNISREFVSGDDTVVAVDDVSFQLDDGVFAAVVGPSGSGKSTLLSLLGTLDMPTSGSIEIDGRDVTAMSGSELTAYRRGRIGFVFQSYNLIPNLTALQNVMLPMEFAGVRADQRRARAGELLAQVGLDEAKQHRKPGRLSGGEQQRVAIARALANRPCLVLADEPTGNLDHDTGAMIVELLHELARSERTTILAVTHDLEVASAADATFRLHDGRFVDTGGFERAAEDANAAYERWSRERDAAGIAALADALAAMITAAPAGKRLSAAKIRRRYPKAVGEDAFEKVMGRLEGDDLFEDPK